MEQLIRTLIAAYPNGKSGEELLSAMHGGSHYGPPRTATNGASVMVWRLRRRLEPHGWTIAAAYRGGQYRLMAV